VTRSTTSIVAHAADRLVDAIDRLGAPVCVGLDPVVERLPEGLRAPGSGDEAAAASIESFSLGVIDAVTPFVPCVKFQSGCYERYGHRGVAALERCIAAARERGLEVILDAKRGDIGISAEHYAASAFCREGKTAPDRCARWITINPYMGEDSVRAFLREGCGAFAIVRSSNPGGEDLQVRQLIDGRTVAECVAELVAAIGRDFVGQRGYSGLGAVVGATSPGDAADLRKRMPQQMFLVPGYGAQGGSVEDVLGCFNIGGRGAIVTASRSVVYSFQSDDLHWEDAVGEAARRFASEIGRAVGMR